ncbi:hypothetical protein A1Q1_02621 [Trichosporon asahii var. asahii CBS 2479]|uniref:Putative zinc-finger domain-containing protein n=1 Tax=Trichosporon asahii var. asahii (strain ATCC 90039 / CBS 2479 / JCM 2466 / KCTC 7840 / NBRC 103889/ NCYC 2677 / UAMH 7654) TaxID=1186058 RepID=J5QNW4_TRIAS|nr:hypothetical protein A1Q1_02621 [Trichosporon asahii var. asahii CBS 2479]EJT48338.1 hypothetical protein A1Q1_02621 [Trichosporon asahii var. asahii CBS 2479]
MSADPSAEHVTTSKPTDVPPGTDNPSGSTASDVAALRAAVLKSALHKRRTEKPQEGDKEDGEISEGDDGKATSTTPSTMVGGKTSPLATVLKSGRPESATKAGSLPDSPKEQIKRSTVVTISNNAGEVKRTLPVPGGKIMSEDDENQYLDIIRNLLHDGVQPDTLIDNGAPSALVTRVCEEIVAGSKSRQTLWHQARSPIREDSEARSATAGLTLESSQPASSEIPSPSSSIEVAVHSIRQSSESESENEAAVERMTAPSAPSRRPSIPRIIPTSSWTPSQGPMSGGAVRIQSYRPPSRPTSAMSTPIGPSPLVPSPLSTLPHFAAFRPPPPTLPSFPPPPPPQQSKRTKRHRDYDSVKDHATYLNYGDEDASPAPSPSTSSTVGSVNGVPAARPANDQGGQTSTAAPTVTGSVERSTPAALAVPDMASKASGDPPSTSSQATVVSPASSSDLAEVRRKALESMRLSLKKKKALPVTTAPPVPTLAEQAAKLEREVTGSSAEVPMDIDDDEPEEGEIEDSPAAGSAASTPVSSVAPTPPVVVTSTSLRRTASSRGVKRPLAEDLNDNSGRPKSVARVMLNRRAFGAPQRSTRLIISLDDDSDSDGSSDEDTPQPAVVVPRIVIPSPFPEPDTAALLAAKAESIRKLKEQIAARMLAKKSSRSTPVASTSSTPAPAEDARRVEEAVAAAQNVGVEGLSSDVVEAAVLAAAEERKQSDEAGARRRGKGKGKGKAVDQIPASSSSNVDQDGVCSMFRSPLRLLTRQMTLKFLKLLKDPAASICRSEAAGGSCADPACEDVHILRSEPTDDDILTYATRLAALQGSKVSKKLDRAAALKQAKAEVMASNVAAMDTEEAEARWANAENLTALVDLTAQRLRAR